MIQAISTETNPPPMKRHYNPIDADGYAGTTPDIVLTPFQDGRKLAHH